MSDSYVLPVLTRGAIRRDTRKLLRGLDPAYTLDAAAKLAQWDRPALIAWSANDRFFPAEHAERLAKLIPGARLEWIEGARTFSAEDAPERLAVGDRRVREKQQRGAGRCGYGHCVHEE